MPTDAIVSVIIPFIMAGVLALLSFRSFKEKGFLLNNAYLYATEEERKTMNKKPWYRQSAICFCLLSVAFILLGLYSVFDKKVFIILVYLVFAGTVVYAIASSVKINRREGQRYIKM
ncbi:MAG: DUF3784 domain-containing protein [Lachnospiraceae bacterium]|nr:DUF3784 domain-containing protein [Lachnospiraceae bacterium]